MPGNCILGYFHRVGLSQVCQWNLIGSPISPVHAQLPPEGASLGLLITVVIGIGRIFFGDRHIGDR
jgi:hypothetical protein